MKSNKSINLGFVNISTSISSLVKLVNSGNYSDNTVKKMFFDLSSKTGVSVVTSNTRVFLRDGGNKPESYYNWQINKECKGVLFNLIDGKLEIIVVPPSHLSPIRDFNKIEKILQDSSTLAYEVMDTSLVYLYHNGINWLLSSGNCFDLSLDNDSFLINKEIIDDCLIDLIPKLDILHTYTFSIRHPKIQIMATKPERYLSCVKKYGKSVIEKIDDVETIKPIEVDMKDIRNIVNAPMDQTNKAYSFGIILRNKTSNVIIESNRFKFINKTIYRNLHTKDVEQEIRNIYQTSENKVLIKTLLPAYEKIFEEEEKIIDLAAADIYEYLVNGHFTNYPVLAKDIKLVLDISYTKQHIHIDTIKHLIMISKYGCSLYSDRQ